MDTKFFNKWFNGLNEGLEKMNPEECSRQSMIHVFENLVPNRKFKIECMETILAGSDRCCHRIIFED